MKVPTDVTSQAVFVRFSNVNIMRKEFIKLMTISTKTTSQEWMNVVEFANPKININNIVSITMDLFNFFQKKFLIH